MVLRFKRFDSFFTNDAGGRRKPSDLVYCFFRDEPYGIQYYYLGTGGMRKYANDQYTKEIMKRWNNSEITREQALKIAPTLPAGIFLGRK